MFNIDDALAQAEQLLVKQLAQVSNGYPTGPRAAMQQTQRGVAEVLKQVELEGRGNVVAHHAWRATMLMEEADKTGVLKASSGPVGSNYTYYLEQALMSVREARKYSTPQELSEPHAPMLHGRKDWTLQQWQEQDPAGLVSMGGYPLAFQKLVADSRTPARAPGIVAAHMQTVAAQLPELRKLLSNVLQLVGQSLDDIEPDRLTGTAAVLLAREQGILKSLDAANEMVPPGRVTSLVFFALQQAQNLAESTDNVVRRLANREGGVEIGMYASYTTALRSIATATEQAQAAAQETSA